ncbi:SAV_2336 N-terminal domain-related protein [Streptomyces sp. P9(2023)]|uniref:SAV_2336 N-terminal domain-related protein n=1 Tax=Streptomyces sp. P9(2023) TaxID=3064394 RepID=UPI0028F416FA|nr:SAV_2336 N-terminal domain-related protein [Streptomyces sp. P9(2023)]MDT9688132.1 SAV_2336 N-terminal domain-related protein [Streptomyces sp. P9(2023)]
MHRMHLEELTRRLRAGGQDPTAEEVADAVWLAQWLPSPPPDPDPDADPDADPDVGPDSDLAAHSGARPHDPEHREPSGEGRDPANGDGGDGGDAPSSRTGTDTGPGIDGERAPGGGTGPGDDGTRPARPSDTVDIRPFLSSSGAGTSAARGTAGSRALPVRAPGANALPGLLGLQKALRPLRHYAHFPLRPGEGLLDEEATAERSAAAGILLPVLRPAAGRRPDIQLLMDTGPAMVVWTRMVEELRQACQQSGAFRDVQVHRLYDTGDGAPLVTTTSGADGRPRLRPGDQLHDPTGRRLTLIVSDCVGPLWQRGAAQRLIHQWPRQSPLALVQPLPPRLWPRTALSVEPGLLLRPAAPGGHTGFQPDEEPWEPTSPDTRAVPVLTPTPEAFASWARLHAGHGSGAVRGWAALIAPEPPRTAATVTSATTPRTPAKARAPRSDEELLRAFTAGASPGALRLAVHLAAAPLALPVMQLVQRAMLPDTGPMELAEVLLSGLLRQLPGPAPYPCFSYAPRVQQHLLGSLDRGAAALVLKHCSEYVERNFGQGMRNFPALAAARLAGHRADGEPSAAPGPVEGDEGTDEPTGPVGTEPELFARIPARVLRFYHPDLITPDPLAAARRLFDQWLGQSDSSLLGRARGQAEAALPDHPVEAGILLGRVLYAESGTAAVQGTERRQELLSRALTELERAGGLAEPGGAEWAEARLEQAVAHHGLWRHTADPQHLDDALAALFGDVPDWPEVHHHTLHLRRGRLLLARGDGAAAATELTTALSLRESAPALLDLADALHLAGADPAEVVPVLDRAEPLLGEATALRLRWTTARARLYDAAGDGPAADTAYEEATLLAPADSGRRGRILMTWGESLMRRAATAPGQAPVDRAEGVLREALTSLPADAPERARAGILIGTVLALRFHRAGFLPDLFESRHLLEQAARTTRDIGLRSEVWLQLGRVRLELSESARVGVLGDALTAFERAGEDARSAHGDTPGTITGARALHAQGAVLSLMGRNARARTVLRAAADQWRRLTAALVEVDWSDVERTRTLLAEVGAEQNPYRPPLSAEDRRRIAPPWWTWSETAG